MALEAFQRRTVMPVIKFNPARPLTYGPSGKAIPDIYQEALKGINAAQTSPYNKDPSIVAQAKILASLNEKFRLGGFRAQDGQRVSDQMNKLMIVMRRNEL
jgi:hypothetical protein